MLELSSLWPPRGGCWRVVNCSVSWDTSGQNPRVEEAQRHTPNSYLCSAFLFALWNTACLLPLRYPVSNETSQSGWSRKRTIHWTSEKVGVLFPKSRDAGRCSSKQKYLLESLTGNVMWQHYCSNTFSSLIFFFFSFFSFTLNGILDIFQKCKSHYQVIPSCSRNDKISCLQQQMPWFQGSKLIPAWVLRRYLCCPGSSTAWNST